MERFWNIIHYFAYRADYKFHLLFNKINPFLLINRLPFQKRLYEKKGIKIQEKINKAFRDPKHGLSIIRTGGLMFGLIFIGCLGFANLYYVFSHTRLDLKIYHFIVFTIIGIMINYFLLFKQEKYLKYFKEFNKMPKAEKIRWAWVSFGVIIGIILFFISSFILLVHQKI